MFWHRLLLLSISVSAWAQDPFEIQVFEYEPLPLGAYTYEAHINYVVDGTTEHQLHFSSEWTAGITDQIRAGVTILTAEGAGIGIEYAGVRFLPHFYAPRSWHLPVNLGLLAEFSFERSRFNADTRVLELRGITEKHAGRLQMDGNIVFERALHGPGTAAGWKLEPSGRIAWQARQSLTPSLEYYGELGQKRAHLLLPGADWKIRERVTWSFGVGMALAGAGNQVVLKTRLEFEFGRNKVIR
jgi:hypothetical protein